jgi:hypothetical protein
MSRVTLLLCLSILFRGWCAAFEFRSGSSLHRFRYSPVNAVVIPSKSRSAPPATSNCCEDGSICFNLNPPATQSGLEIRCLLTNAGFNVEWTTPDMNDISDDYSDNSDLSPMILPSLITESDSISLNTKSNAVPNNKNH